MALRYWQPHRAAAVAIVILLWPAAAVCLPHAAVALAQSAGCSISSPDVSLDATCTLDDAGNLSGTFTAPQAPTSSQTQTPGACPTFAGGNGTCTNQITVNACADASSALCASAPFGIEAYIVSAPAPATPALARAIPETGICPAACRSGRTAWFYEPAITVKLTVGNPVITLAPSHGQPGTSVTVTGVGFAIAPTTAPPTTAPPTTAPPTTAQPTTAQPTTTPHPEPAPSNFLLLGVVAIGAVAVLVTVVLLMRRRPPKGGPPSADVRARVSGATPRPLMRNTAGRPAGIVRVEVHRQTIKPRIEKRTRR